MDNIYWNVLLLKLTTLGQMRGIIICQNIWGHNRDRMGCSEAPSLFFSVPYANPMLKSLFFWALFHPCLRSLFGFAKKVILAWVCL